MTRTPPLVGATAPAGLPAEECEALAAIFRALADPVRLRLFAAIAATPEPLCVCHLPDCGVSQPTVSHHLRKLREAGLIESERRGTWVHCRATEAGGRAAMMLTATRGQA